MKKIIIYAIFSILIYANSVYASQIGDADSAYKQGSDFMNLKQYDKAVPCLKKAIELNPKLAMAHLGLAYAYQNTNQGDLAIQSYENYVALNPNYIPAYLNLSAQYMLKNDIYRAYKWLRIAKSHNQNDKTVNNALEMLKAKYGMALAISEQVEKDKSHAQVIQTGKFVFDSNRFEVSDVFITENGKTRLLLKKASHPAWSSDGMMIACAGSNGNPKKYGFWILDSKGNKKEFVETPAGIPGELNWSPDDTKIYYTLATIPWRKSGYKNKVYYYEFLSKTHTKIIELDDKFAITNLKLSPKGDKLIVSGIGEHNNPGSYISNSDGTDIRLLGIYRGDGPWYPDNEHIAYIANVTEDGQMYIKEGWGKEGWGYFFRMNVNTGEVEKLWLCKTFLLNLKISRDGKYFYYIAPALGGGQAVFVSPIDNPDKKIQITHPIFLTPATYGHSQDRFPDWYQD